MSKTKTALRSLMEKKANGTTGRRMQMTTQYTKLPQNISDDDDDEEMNIEIHQSENHQNFKQEIVELEKLCPTDSAQDEILIQGQTLSRARSVCFALSLLFCIAFTLGFIFVAPCRQLPCETKHQTNKTSDWEKVFPNHVITSHICLVEGDNNHQNILLALISPAVKKNISNNNTRKICENKGDNSCNSLLFLLRGDDGHEIWQLSFKSIINSINCQQLDINGNGWKDCIISGSMGLVMAIDPRKGIVLWKSESVLLKSTWIAFGPQMLQDFDGDGIAELVVRVGQNIETTIEKEEDRLIMISGKTGAVMPYFLKIPGSGQSYISPIIYKKPDKSSYILFSSFEESESSASLWIISFPDFYRLVENFPSDYIITKIEGPYKPWPGIVADHLGLLKIHSFYTKGLSIAPIIIDLTQDGIDDVLIEQFGGSLVLLDGVTWQVVWQKQFVGWESFSSPAPGYFNNDSILDLMVRRNFGIWPDYNESMICILDGRTGDTLWSLSSGLSDFSSPFSFHTALPYRDVFAFAVSGRSLPSGTTAQNMFLLNSFTQINKRSTNILEPIENLPEMETHPFLSHIITPEVPHIHEELTSPEMNSQEHFESQSEENQLLSNYSKLMPDESSPFQIVPDSRQQQEMGLCNENIVPHVTEVFLMDRSFNKKSLLLTKFNFGQYHYNFSKKIQKTLSTSKELCALYETTGLLTGAVGDVDADGCLDFVAVSVAAATLINEEIHYEVKLKKININTKVTDPKYIEIPAVMKAFTFSDLSLTATSFSSLQTQSWIQFQGVRGDSRYP